MERNVDLPQPDGPDTDRYSPRSMSSVRSFSAQVSSFESVLKILVIPSRRTSGICESPLDSPAAVDFLRHHTMVLEPATASASAASISDLDERNAIHAAAGHRQISVGRDRHVAHHTAARRNRPGLELFAL